MYGAESFRSGVPYKKLSSGNPLSYLVVKTALLYDNFCKTGNYVIYDIIIWVQDGNCEKW